MEQTGNELLQVFEALANPHRMHIIASLQQERKYVSELAREMGMSRPLLYMHLKRLEHAGLVVGNLELSEDGKAMKFYELLPFDLRITAELVTEAAAQLKLQAAEATVETNHEGEK